MKDFRYLALYELYGNLLTDVQREVFRAYYACDLSLAEIAEERGGSRQSVADALKKARKELEETERRLGFYARGEKLKVVLGDMRARGAGEYADAIANVLWE